MILGKVIGQQQVFLACKSVPGKCFLFHNAYCESLS